MFGNLGNLTGLLKSAKEIQSNMARMQETLAAKRFEGEAGGGLVRAIVDGKGILQKIRIDPQATADVELLEDMVAAAVASAVARSQDELKSEMMSMTGGMNLPPGLMNMLGGGQ